MIEIDLFETFFKTFEVRAHRISWDSRIQLGLLDGSFTFGLVTLQAVEQILKLIKPTSQDSLLDMGSGIGKLVMGASYLYPDLRATGVELLPPLHELAEQILDQFEKQLLPKAHERVQLVCADMFDVSLKEHSIVFVNSICMSDELLARTIEHLVTKANDRTRIISLGRLMTDPGLELYDAGAWRMGWQSLENKTPVYIYEKLG